MTFPLPQFTILPRRAFTALACGLALSASVLATAEARDAYPSRPITLIVPYAPGGTADSMNRLLGKFLADRLGQPVLIDNRPGGGTVIAASALIQSPPDGYTILGTSSSTLTMNPALRSDLPYDPIESFEPLGIVARLPAILVANNDAPASNVQEFVELIRANPDKYEYGSFGIGTVSNFAGEIIKDAIDGKMIHVPYRGAAPAMTDLLGGQIPFAIDMVVAAAPQIAAGKVKPIAVTTQTRAFQLPDVPTFQESGYPEVDIDSWVTFVLPKGTPAPIVRKLEQTLADIMADPAAQAALRELGVEAMYTDGASVRAQIEQELPLMRDIVKRTNMTID